MAYTKVEQDIVLEKLMDVFRSVGYDGASMTDLADATGLKKASLYHRFPEGKEAMAHAVLNHVANWNNAQIFDILVSSGPVEERLDTALKSIDTLYNGGRVACILRALSHGRAAEIFRSEIAEIFGKWVTAFAHVAGDVGHDPQSANRLGESTLIRIQGSLILAQTLHRPDLFQDALRDIKTDFLK